MQTLCRARADSADLLQTLRIFFADFFLKVCSKRTLQTIENSARFRMQTILSGLQSLHKGSFSSGPSKNLAIHYYADARSAYQFGHLQVAPKSNM